MERQQEPTLPVNPLTNIIKQIDRIKDKSYPAEQLEQHYLNLLFQLKSCEEMLGKSEKSNADINKNPLFQFIRQQLTQALDNLKNKEAKTLHSMLLTVLKLHQTIKKAGNRLQASEMKSLADDLFFKLNQFFINFGSTSATTTQLTQAEIDLMLRAPLEKLPHYRGNKSIYYQDVLILYQLIRQDYEIDVKNAERLYHQQNSGNEKQQLDYSRYVLSTVQNTIAIIQLLMQEKIDPAVALEQLYCNMTINSHVSLAAAQGSLHKLVADCVAPDVLIHLTRKKTYYLQLIEPIKNHAIYVYIFVMLLETLEEIGNLNSNTKDDRAKLVTLLQSAKASSDYSISNIMTVLEKIVKISSESKKEENKRKYQPFINKLLNIITHPLIALPSDVLERLRGILRFPAITDAVEQPQISLALYRQADSRVHYLSARYTNDQVAILLEKDKQAVEMDAWSREQTELYEFLEGIVAQLTSLNQHLTREIEKLPEVAKRNYGAALGKYNPDEQSGVSSTAYPWALMNELLIREEKNQCTVQFTKTHMKFICGTQQTTYLDDFQTAVMQLEKLNNSIFRLLENNKHYPITPKNVIAAFSDLISILVSTEYRQCIKDLFIHSAGRARQIEEKSKGVESNIYVVTPFLNLLDNFTTHLSDTSAFLRNWCSAVIALCQEHQIGESMQLLMEIQKQLVSLSKAYEGIFADEVRELSLTTTRRERGSAFLDSVKPALPSPAPDMPRLERDPKNPPPQPPRLPSSPATFQAFHSAPTGEIKSPSSPSLAPSLLTAPAALGSPPPARSSPPKGGQFFTSPSAPPPPPPPPSGLPTSTTGSGGGKSLADLLRERAAAKDDAEADAAAGNTKK